MNIGLIAKIVALMALAYVASFFILTWLSCRSGRFAAALKRLLCRLNGYRFRGAGNVIFQGRSLSCGAACVEMALRHHGVPYQAGQVRELEESRGTSMLDLLDALGGFGLHGEGRRYGNLDEFAGSLRDGRCALVLFNASFFVCRENVLFFPFFHLLRLMLKGNFNVVRHWVMVPRQEDSGQLLVRDPYLGELSLPADRFGRLWDGTALVVSR